MFLHGSKPSSPFENGFEKKILNGVTNIKYQGIAKIVVTSNMYEEILAHRKYINKQSNKPTRKLTDAYEFVSEWCDSACE